ncbi:sensor histidine kinase, partial [Clostridium sp.]|uniref:sensor histidine kinase n=1 Tax=Clostridium sp. TaxID=1506 RepID=UPI003F34E129
ITNVSHDLRTPLTSIIGYLNIVDNDRYRDEVELRYYVEIAYEKAKVLDVLINDLFELTKMRNKGVTINKHRVDIVELLGQLIASYKIQLDNVNMVGRTFFSNEKFIINGDGSQLVRVFENLISNAMRYGCDSKYIDIITEVNEQWGRVIIKNYGEPIPEIDIPHIFDRFYKVDKSRTSEKRGSGLGLAIAKGIIEMHEGMISVESNYEGTSFIITLPLQNN